MPDPVKICRFIVSDPQQGRQQKTGIYRIHHQPSDLIYAKERFDLLHLSPTSCIAVQNRRPDTFVFPVQYDNAVHLPGKADAFDLLRTYAALLYRLLYRMDTCLPPLFGIMFCKIVTGRLKLIASGCNCL